MNVNKKTRVFVSGRPFQPTPMFVGKVRAPERSLQTLTNYGLTLKYLTRLVRSVRYKHSSSLQTFINYDGKKFCNIDLLLKTATTESDR
jgi:hypothetical protein